MYSAVKYSVLQGIALFVFHSELVHLEVVIVIIVAIVIMMIIIECISSSKCFSNVS